MARIKLEARKLNAAAKCTRGDVIVSLSQGNPRVPGNEEVLQKFIAANEHLRQVLEAVKILEGELASKMAEQAAAVRSWCAAATARANITEVATGGDAGAMQGAGFGVRDARSPTPALGAVGPVRVMLNEEPGYSDLRWRPLKGAVGYIVEGTDDANADGGWTHAGFSTKAKFTANGATPGRVHWYRVAALNAEGQGPWSAPSMRAVL